MPRKKSAVEVMEKQEVATAPIEPEQDKAKRVFRAADERIAEIDKKIEFHRRSITQLEARRAKIGTPRRTRKLSISKVIAELKASGKTPEELLELINRG